MKILKDKYGRRWLVNYGTYTLLNINHTGVLNHIKTIVLILMCNVLFSQTSIVAAGNANETFGETFPIMQNAQKEVTLNVPKYEIPIEPPKPIVKKQSLWQKIILIIKKLFR